MVDFKDISDFIKEKFCGDGGFFLNRMGGSDFTSVQDYKMNDDKINDDRFFNDYDRVSNFNGYFDKETNLEIKKRNYEIYVKLLYSGFINSQSLSIGGINLLQSALNNDKLNNIHKSICQNKPIFSYSYIEEVYPFLNDFKVFAENKNILFVSPFSETIRHQFKYKDDIPYPWIAGKNGIGVIADEFAELFPEYVENIDNPEKYQQVVYVKSIPLLLTAITDLNQRLSAIEQQLGYNS